MDFALGPHSVDQAPVTLQLLTNDLECPNLLTECFRLVGVAGLADRKFQLLQRRRFGFRNGWIRNPDCLLRWHARRLAAFPLALPMRSHVSGHKSVYRLLVERLVILDGPRPLAPPETNGSLADAMGRCNLRQIFVTIAHG
jgi:hypothetical protein